MLFSPGSDLLSHFDQQDERIFIEVRTDRKPRENKSLIRGRGGGALLTRNFLPFCIEVTIRTFPPSSAQFRPAWRATNKMKPNDTFGLVIWPTGRADLHAV